MSCVSRPHTKFKYSPTSSSNRQRSPDCWEHYQQVLLGIQLKSVLGTWNHWFDVLQNVWTSINSYLLLRRVLQTLKMVFPQERRITISASKFIQLWLAVCLFPWFFLLIYAGNTFAWMIFSRSLWRHRLLPFVLLKTLSLYCSSPINRPLWYSCVSNIERQQERGSETEGGREETDSQDMDEPWEKRGLGEEKQKCLRTFLCDYTELDKSRHSSTYSVSLGRSSISVTL